MVHGWHTEPHGSEHSVLVVSPEAETRALAAFMLKRLGYEVVEAHDALEAQRIYDERAGQVDLLVTEALMSRINGHHLADSLRARNPKLRVLFLSDASYERMARRVAAQKRQHFLVRPFTMAQLSAKVRESMDPAEAHSQAAG